MFIRGHVPKQKPVSLICIGSFPGRPTFRGLGELQPHELAALFPARRRVGPPEHHLAQRAWRAFRDATPTSLEIVRHSDTSPLPFLARALQRFLQDYPWTRDGLSRTERRLMTLVAEGRAEWPAVYPRMSEGEDAFYVTDTALRDLTASLTSGATPLLTSRDNALSLTRAGRDVLQGRADRVKLCGLDRWYGGVHMHGRDTAWRWDGEQRSIVPWR